MLNHLLRDTIKYEKSSKTTNLANERTYQKPIFVKGFISFKKQIVRNSQNEEVLSQGNVVLKFKPNEFDRINDDYILAITEIKSLATGKIKGYNVYF